MKFTALALTLLPMLALTSPVPEDASAEAFDSTPSMSLDKRSITGVVDADALKYRRCPRTSCDAVGQYPRGYKMQIDCYTATDTTTVNGDP
jgi:hypothetical protein